jgi:hypothetical protein
VHLRPKPTQFDRQIEYLGGSAALRENNFWIAVEVTYEIVQVPAQLTKGVLDVSQSFNSLNPVNSRLTKSYQLSANLKPYHFMAVKRFQYFTAIRHNPSGGAR